MSATDRHIIKIKAVRLSLELGEKTIREILQDTGLHRITVKEILHEAQAWGAVTFDDNGKWSLGK